MNYADMALGTWYPMGGMYKVVEGMVCLAKSLGVKFKFNCAVQQIVVKGNQVKSLLVKNEAQHFHYVVGAADYHHVEQHLLPASHRRYDEAYWQDRVMAPSSLIFYVGVNKRLKNLLHHNLFFDQDFLPHAKAIYEIRSWVLRRDTLMICFRSSSE